MCIQQLTSKAILSLRLMSSRSRQHSTHFSFPASPPYPYRRHCGGACPPPVSPKATPTVTGGGGGPGPHFAQVIVNVEPLGARGLLLARVAEAILFEARVAALIGTRYI
ncbi:hypothetical protein PG984_007366 [Apiospora sp. TS-2023a]